MRLKLGLGLHGDVGKFAPNRLNGLGLWLDAADTSTITSNGDGYRVLMVGDSTTYGKGANNLEAFGVEGAHVNSPSRVLSEYLGAYNVIADSHSIVGLGNNGAASSSELYFNQTPDVSLALNGWDKLDFNSIGANLYSNSGTTGELLTFSFGNVDKGAIGLPIRSYGTLRYRVDGGSWTSVSETGTDDLLRIDIDFGSIGNHTVEFEYVSGGAVYVSYVEAWSSRSDVVLIPWGARGYSSNGIVQTTRPWSYQAALAEVPFDAIILNIGINDVRSGGSGTTEATFEANVESFLDAALAANPSVDLYIQIPNDISTGLSYVPASLTSIATSYGATLLDSRLAPNMSDYSTANAAGLMFDTLHPNEAGYATIWNYFASLIYSDFTTKRYVTNWADKSGNSHDAENTTGSREPISNTSPINGRNAITANDSVNSYLQTVNNVDMDEITFFAVLRNERSYPSSNVLDLLFRHNSAPEPLSSSYNGYIDNTAPTVRQEDLAGDLFLNGAPVSLNDTFSPDIDVMFTVRSGNPLEDNTMTVLGAASAGFPWSHLGRVGEMIFYNRQLSDIEINKVGRYLSSKWGINWTDI